MKDWKCASESGWPERIWVIREEKNRACVRSIARISGEGTKKDRSTHDGVEVGLHELFVEINLIKVPIRAKDNIHVIQASDLGLPRRKTN